MSAHTHASKKLPNLQTDLKLVELALANRKSGDDDRFETKDKTGSKHPQADVPVFSVP